jgi:membrane protease YdiL (CAAX protease family)
MSYWQSTRHPGPCLLFLAPLLITYEWGVLSLGGADAATLRNGADAWTRDGLTALGVHHPVAAPAVVVAVVAVWFWRKRDSIPDDAPSLCLGIAIESVANALTLWMLSRLYAPALDWLGTALSTKPPPLNATAAGQVVTYLGAGIYEEVMFRMVLFGGLAYVLSSALGAKGAAVFAALASSLLFAAAHHVGPHGEPVDGFNFLFRALAGLYFTAVYRLRGFGVAVGAHACYDVLVGIAM